MYQKRYVIHALNIFGCNDTLTNEIEKNLHKETSDEPMLKDLTIKVTIVERDLSKCVYTSISSNCVYTSICNTTNIYSNS